MLNRSRRAAREAFESLAREVYSDLHGYVLRQVGSNDVDDVVSESLMTAWRRWDDRPPTYERCRAWVFGIAHKKVLECFRRRDRDRKIEIAATASLSAAVSAGNDAVITDRTSWWLAQLPVHERAAVYLMTILGFTAAEAGTILGHPASTVSARVSRALARLRPVALAETGRR